MSQRILLVEDEVSIAETVAYALTAGGFVPTCKSTAAEALLAVESETFALIILDVGLPDASGFDLARELRRRSSIPIIFLTARSSEIDRVVGLELGGDDYVTKPFSPRELVARVRAILRRSVPEQLTSSSSPFKDDEHRQLITYFGVPLDLSRYEYRILRLLLSRPGWVFSREKLMEIVWEAPEMSLERTVDTHMKTIRAKLRKVRPDLDAIRTHRGIGYSLREEW